MKTDLNLVFVISMAYATYIWLHTNVLWDYFGRFLKKLPYFHKYQTEWIDKNMGASLPFFLSVEKPSFLVRLICCPICLTFWGAVIFWLFWDRGNCFLPNAAAGLVVYHILRMVSKD